MSAGRKGTKRRDPEKDSIYTRAIGGGAEELRRGYEAVTTVKADKTGCPPPPARAQRTSLTVKTVDWDVTQDFFDGRAAGSGLTGVRWRGPPGPRQHSGERPVIARLRCRMAAAGTGIRG